MALGVLQLVRIDVDGGRYWDAVAGAGRQHVAAGVQFDREILKRVGSIGWRLVWCLGR